MHRYNAKFFCVCLSFFLSLSLCAQLCTGSLGDNIVNISFDNNSISPGVTEYQSAGGCPNPAEYCLTNFLFGCANDTWYVIAGDHTKLLTGNIKSNVMLVNAQDNPNVVIRDTVKGLCGNITYQFAAYISNIMKDNACGGNAVLPNLSFIVETDKGELLANYNTGDIKESDQIRYTQYGVFFTSPPQGGTVVLTIKSNPVSGCGAVFAIDDITLQPCGSAVTVTVNNLISPYTYTCAGYTNPFVLHASYLGFTNPKSFWQYSTDTGFVWNDIPGATTDTYTIPYIDSGVILYRIIVAEDVNINSPECRIASQPMWIQVNPLPPYQPLQYLNGCLDKNFTMPFIAGGTNYDWSGPNSFQSISYTPVIQNIQYKDSGLYKLTLTNDAQCSATDSLYLNVYPSSTVSVTPVFSICQGQKIQFDASGGETYLWTPSQGLSNDTIPNPTLQPADSIKYKIVAANEYGCKDSATVMVNVNRNVSIIAGSDKYILSNDTATLNPSIKGTAVNYYWSPSDFINDVHLQNPKVNPPYAITYTLHASSGVGCGSGIDDVKVYVYNDVYVPNAFTPNGHGKNDIFRIFPFENYTLERLTIYNRWGKSIFNTTNAGNGWDGTLKGLPQPMDTYIYYIKLHSSKGKDIIKKGTVLLIR
jgi:gliding motility-associated-like protein